ncbi:2Fe-2S iron-sulfur cluster-binding protein [Neosynechococcus sphagnicola]|uniref:2Fe-2S iron-sulfur cluster-binding protein n=1 Tax=Neosynechococcus sphagnicola TaxID=1501145 RepID=UPI000B1C74DC
MTVQIHFLPDQVTITATPGEPFLQVAARAGITIPTGCLMGSCHACEIDIEGGVCHLCLYYRRSRRSPPFDRPSLQRPHLVT